MKETISAIIILLTATFGAMAEEIVIISSSAPKESITEKGLSRIYLKRKVLWEDGKAIVPVNLSSQHPTRVSFSQKILKKSHRELVDYWNEQHFKGVNPPLVLESEEAVKIFIRQVDGAIGYISRKNLEPDLVVLYTFETKE